jgi:catechol 2,3-dioxygenase-like lactoylglutathione lyase family enzyme
VRIGASGVSGAESSKRSAQRSRRPGRELSIIKKGRIHAYYCCNGGSTSPEGDAKNRQRRSSRLTQRRVGLTTKLAQAVPNALRTTHSTFIRLSDSVNSVQHLMQLEGIDHVAMGVRDIERSTKWYIDVLGFERLHDGMWNGVPTFIGKGNTGIALFPANQEPKTSAHREIRMLHLAFRADRENFLAAQQELEKRGIKFEFQDHEIAHSIYFRDPDGHQLEITTYQVD